MNKATVHIELALLQEVPVTIEWDYSPAQKQTLTDPSWCEEVEITSVVLARTGNPVLITADQRDELEQRILEGEFDAPTKEDLA